MQSVTVQDSAFKDDGTPAHLFWEVARVDSKLLRAPVTLDQNSPAFDHSSTVKITVADYKSKGDLIKRLTSPDTVPLIKAKGMEPG